jgi:hypothetical protein
MASRRISAFPGSRYQRAEAVLSLASTAIFFDLGLEFSTAYRVISGNLHRPPAIEKP